MVYRGATEHREICQKQTLPKGRGLIIPVLRERYPQIFNIQFSIVNSSIKRDLRFTTTGLSGLGGVS